VLVEQHAAMRFAWLREKAGGQKAEQGLIYRLICITYNVVWWAPPVLGFLKVIDYRWGTITMLAITVIRAFANLYRTNLLELEPAEVFPLRAP
jgi:hypothetical protein